MKTGKIETVDVGDYVVCQWVDKDVTLTTLGTVARIEQVGILRVLYSAKDAEIARYTVHHPRKIKVVQLVKAPRPEEQLFT